MTLRAGILQTGLMNQSSAQVIDGSLRFDSSKEHYLNRTPSSAGNRRTWTWSCWAKLSAASQGWFLQARSAVGSTSQLKIDIRNDHLRVNFRSGGSTVADFEGSSVLRDFSAWYHFLIACDTTQSTESDRLKFYINGREELASAVTYPSLNFESDLNSAISHQIGQNLPNNVPEDYSDYYLSEAYLIDGQALGPSYFGFTDPLTNTWRPKKFKPQATPNDGTTWSSDITGTPLNSTVGEAFDGSLSATGAQPDSLLTWTPSSTITAQNQIRLYIYQNGYTSQYGTFEQNGTNLATSIASQLGDGVAGWITLPSNTITELKWSRDIGVGSWALRAVEVDGVTLIDGDTTNIGLNAFHLPFDGNSPIGQDKSGRGNDWTPVNFGGSNTIEKATGALPILNTDGGGKVARVGTRTDENASSLVLALPLVGITSDFSATIKGSGTNKTISGSAPNSSSYSQFYGGSIYLDGTDANSLSVASSSDFTPSSGTGFTVEFWFYPTDTDFRIIQTYDNNNDGWLIGYQDFGNAVNGIAYNTSGARGIGLVSSSYPANKWYHIAACWNTDNTCNVFVDGVLRRTIPSDFSTSTVNTLYLSRQPDSSNLGTQYYMNDLRIYKGVAKYTSNFIPASTDPDILPDTPSGVSGSSKLTKITDGAVSFDGSGDYLSLTSSSDFNFGSGAFTVEAWVKTSIASPQTVATNYGSSTTGWSLAITSSGVAVFNVSGDGIDITGTSNVANGAWTHIAVSGTPGATGIKLFVNGVQEGSTYTGATSLDTSSSLTIGQVVSVQYFNGFISNLRVIKGTALYTSDFTPPSAPLTNVTNTKLLCCQSNTSQNIAAVSPNISGVNDGTVWSNYIFKTGTSNLAAVDDPDTQKTRSEAFNGLTGSTNEFISLDGDITFTPPSTITGISQVKVYASGSGTFPNKIYVNGTLQATLTSDTTVTVSTSSLSSVRSERQNTSESARFSGIEVDGVLLKDPVASAGNSAATTFNPFNTDINTVRGQETGYATLNPLVLINGGSSVFSNGNLSLMGGATNGATGSTINPTSGKHFFELDIDYVSGQTQGNMGVGVVNEYVYGVGNPSGNSYPSTFCGFFTRTEINSVVNGTETGTQTTEPTVSYTLGLSVDYDSKSMTFYLNGVTGDTVSFSSVANPLLYFLWGNTNNTMVVNFGQKPFKFPPPAGFQPLNAANVRPSTVIARPDQYVGVTTYTGNGSTQTINGLNFQPDLVWIKSRSAIANHMIMDQVRGSSPPIPMLHTSSTVGESNFDASWRSLYGDFTAFTSSGFTVVGGSSTGNLNDNAVTYVAWAWKAGGNKNTFNVDDVGYATASAAGLDSGSITPTGASVSTKSGFSIITYTGDGTSGAGSSVGHGLGVAPAMVVTKMRAQNSGASSTSNWLVYHKDLNGNVSGDRPWTLYLNETEAQADSDGWGNYGGFTSSVFTVSDVSSFNAHNNNSTSTYVAYCWAEIPGFSKFGTYSGNTLADGVFIELGFRPRLLMIKSINSLGDWIIWDTERDSYNVSKSLLYANTSGIEQDGITDRSPNVIIDILSNGFKCRETNNDYNASEPYIYAAWAEAPSFNLYGATSNAR